MYKKWECIVCGWIYDEELGCPEDGIEPKTKWEDIPEDFEFWHVIKFLPDLPEPEGEDGQHTEEQHEELSRWNVRLQELMIKERKYASNL